MRSLYGTIGRSKFRLRMHAGRSRDIDIPVAGKTTIRLAGPMKVQAGALVFATITIRGTITLIIPRTCASATTPTTFQVSLLAQQMGLVV